jgi:hypothetical protein
MHAGVDLAMAEAGLIHSISTELVNKSKARGTIDAGHQNPPA